eukprot:PLAT4790.1.p1 GENE.PLAT4790.1~~PLAT4790.1.p1  ORF type:complete len:333 (-),score=148.91 PLAT4790.1:121-1119(-)
MDGYTTTRTLRTALFGRVVLAEDNSNGDVVAIKIARRSLAAARRTRRGEAVLEDLDSELAVMRLLSDKKPHGNLLGAREVVETEDRVAIVMPYMEKGELFDVIADGPLPETAARRLFCQLLSGLRHLHALGWAHRDISLENVLCTEQAAEGSDGAAASADDDGAEDGADHGAEDGAELKSELDPAVTSEDDSRRAAAAARLTVKLADFGLAAACEEGGKLSAASKGSRPGKLGYMAPEVYRGAEYDPFQADTFSLGVVLFALLVGVPPFRYPDATMDRRFKMIQNGQLAELLAMWGVTHLSPAAITLLSGMLDADPVDRLSLEDVAAHDWLA